MIPVLNDIIRKKIHTDKSTNVRSIPDGTILRHGPLDIVLTKKSREHILHFNQELGSILLPWLEIQPKRAACGRKKSIAMMSEKGGVNLASEYGHRTQVLYGG